MKNPSNDKNSGKTPDESASKAEKPDESTKPAKDAAKSSAAKTGDNTYKLKKEAAVPGTMATRDTGPGDGNAAKADAGKVTPIESSLVGDAKGLPAAARKGSVAETKSNIPSVAKSEEKSAKVDEKATKPTDSKPDGKALPPSPPPPVIQKTGFWRGVFGGVVGACLVLAVLAWALPNLLAGWVQEKLVNVDVGAIKAEAVAAAQTAAQNLLADESVNAAVESGSTAIGEKVAVFQAKLEEQAQRINTVEDGLKALPKLEPSTDGTGPAVSELSSVVMQLKAQLENQASQLAALSARPILNPESVARVEELAGNAQALQNQISAAAEAAQTQLTTVQAEASKLQETAAETTRRAQAVAAASALQSALNRGVTAEEAKQTLENVGIEAPAALQKDVPSLDSLQDGFASASRDALATVRSGDAVESGNILTNFIKTQTGARSVAPREGDDPDAILSRANAAVESGDIVAALEEMAPLPEPAKSAPAMAEWLAGATAYRDAQKALSDLTAATD